MRFVDKMNRGEHDLARRTPLRMKGYSMIKIARNAFAGVLPLLFALTLWAGGAKSPTVTIKGFVIDSSCAFTKDISKPVSKECAKACAKAGSQLVILSDSGKIYWPIGDATPASGQNPMLLPFAAAKVTVTGKVYERGGSRSIVIEKIGPQGSAK
ncbi:MAG: hypothetical protein WBF14_06000 [Candidatus Acidiferrales bacterium]